MMVRTLNLAGRLALVYLLLLFGVDDLLQLTHRNAVFDIALTDMPWKLAVVALELVGAVALMVGWRLRWTALLLAVTSALAALALERHLVLLLSLALLFLGVHGVCSFCLDRGLLAWSGEVAGGKPGRHPRRKCCGQSG